MPRRVTLNWDQSRGATSYKIQRFVPERRRWTKHGTSSTTRFIARGLQPETEYRFRVLGRRSSLRSAPSRPVKVRTLAAPLRGLDTPPPAGGFFTLKPVGSWSTLPNDVEAALMVRRSTWEPRPENFRQNNTVPMGLALGPHGGVDERWNTWLIPRISGNFVGTTDEIVQWAAAKWGISDDMLRAMMASESYWHQGLLDSEGNPVPSRGFGDYTNEQAKCPPGYTASCPLSFGVLQVKYAPFHPGVFPHNRDSTAFNADYLAAILRGCYEGWELWLRTAGDGSTSNYAAGDIWGCVGRWNSGRWHNDHAERYISGVKGHLADTPWLALSF